MGSFSGFYAQQAFPDKQLWAAFLTALDNMQDGGLNYQRRLAALEAKVAAFQGGTTTIITETVDNGSSGSLEVTITGTFPTGALVHYAGSTAVLADATDATKWANWIVVDSGSGQSTLALLSPDLDILETGTGDDGSGFLYLYTGGGVTRNSAQIEASDGGPVSGFQLYQIVGYSNGLSQTVPASGYLRGAFFPTPGRSL